MRGEYVVREPKGRFLFGSPPHAWGILESQYTVPSVKKDHPHMRGEYPSPNRSIEMVSGSPPHAWGIPASVVPSLRPLRITPTCVGNTLNDSRHNSIFKLVNVHFL